MKPGLIVACDKCGEPCKNSPVLDFLKQHECGGTYRMMTKATAAVLILNYFGEKLVEKERNSHT